MRKNQALSAAIDSTDDIVQLQRLIRTSVLTGSDQELDAFFGDLKTALITVDNEFKILYINNTAANLVSDKEYEAEKGSMVIDFVKRILSPSSLISFYEHLIHKNELKLSEGFTMPRIERIGMIPIGTDGFVIKVWLNERYTDSAANLFRYFPGLPIAYFGFDLLAGKRLSIRFLSDNFHILFPFLDIDHVIADENYFLSNFHPDDLPEFLSKIQHLKKGKDSFNTEFRLMKPDGSEHWYRLISGKFSERKDKNFWLAYIEDIDEKKKPALEKERLVYETLDEERNRMAMELHDGLGQNLVALNLYLSTVMSETENRMLGICRDLAKESIMLMKSMCYNLAPPELDRGLLYALDVYFGKMNELSGNIEYVYNAKKVPLTHMTQENAYNIFRIIQEFVTNSRKYSECTTIECTIGKRNQKMILEIHDNGIGFDMRKIETGFGLKNMVKRAHVANASIELISAPGEGTAIIIEF